MKHVLAILTLCLLSVAANAATFLPLGSFAGNFYSEAQAISADGTIVTGYSTSSTGQFEAFRWTSGSGMSHLGSLPAAFIHSGGLGISPDGSVITGWAVSGSSSPFIRNAATWTNGVGPTSIGYLPGGSLSAQGLDASSSGTVIVGESSTPVTGGNTVNSFMWTAGGGMVNLGVLPGATEPGSRAAGVTADGSVIVGYARSGSGIEAFRWTAGGGMVGLGDLPGGIFDSQAMDISPDGLTIVGVGRTSTGQEAFRWTQAGGMVGLGALGAGSQANALSDDGSVIVGNSGPGAFVWTGTGASVLRDVLLAQGATGLTGWAMTTATAVSADGGTIVGYGTNPNGKREAWVASWDPNGVLTATVPVPGAVWLFGSALGLMGVLRRKISS